MKVKKHKCGISKELKDESNKLLKSLEKRGYCVAEMMAIIMMAETSLRDSFIIEHILESLNEEIRVKIMTNPSFQKEIGRIKNIMEGSAG